MIASAMIPTDLAELIPQDEQAGPVDLSPDRAQVFIDAGPCFSVRAADGRLIFVGGLIDQGGGKAHCWSRIATLTVREFVPLTAMVRRVIDAAGYRRTVMEVRTGFDRGHRWARHLGFVREGTMTSWGADGQDFDLYARIRRGD